MLLIIVFSIIVFSLSITAVFRVFLSMVWSEQNKQATIFPQQLCQSLPQTFLTFAVVQNPCRPQSKTMPNPRFDGNVVQNPHQPQSKAMPNPRFDGNATIS